MYDVKLYFVWWCTYIPWDDLLWPKNGTKTPSSAWTVITMCENHVSQHNTIYRYKQNKTHYQQQTFEATDERTERNRTNKRTNERKKQQYQDVRLTTITIDRTIYVCVRFEMMPIVCITVAKCLFTAFGWDRMCVERAHTQSNTPKMCIVGVVSSFCVFFSHLLRNKKYEVTTFHTHTFNYFNRLD